MTLSEADSATQQTMQCYLPEHANGLSKGLQRAAGSSPQGLTLKPDDGVHLKQQHEQLPLIFFFFAKKKKTSKWPN